MDKLKKFIEELLAQGKSEEEIVAEVAATDNTEVNAEVNESAEGEEATAKEIVAEVEKAFKAIDAAKTFTAKKESTAKELEAQKQIDARVKKTLEGIKLESSTKESVEVKTFNHMTKKSEKSAGMSEEVKAFAEMLGCLNEKNYDRAKGINKDIESQKLLDYKKMGIKTPLYSDATTGSYLMPTEVEAEIFQRAYQSKMLQVLNTATVTFNDKLYPIVADFDLAFITDETTQIGDKTPALSNPSISMERIGGMTYASNNLLALKGSSLVAMFVTGFGDAIARFVDLYAVASSVTGNSDLFNGIVFDANTSNITAKALSAIEKSDFLNLKNDLGAKFRGNAVYLANTEVYDAYGTLADSAGNPYFKNFVDTGNLRPFGRDFIENAYIPDTFDIATSKRTTGTDNVLVCLDPSAVIVGFDQLRIESSEHSKFDYDQTAWRGLSRMGMKVLPSSSFQGKAATLLKLTD